MLGNFPSQGMLPGVVQYASPPVPEPPCRQSFAQSGSRKQMAAHGAKLQA